MDQYNSEPNSDLTIQQAVAASIGNNVLSSNVAITGVVKSQSSVSAVDVSYTITAPASSAQFTDPSTAYSTFSDALQSSLGNGLFSVYLVPLATTNGAIYLARSSVVPQQAVVQIVLSNPPTSAPTAAPTYSRGSPTPVPTAVPTVNPTSRPTLSPTYIANKPTPAPTINPTPLPSLSPTVSPATIYAKQVCFVF